MMKSPNFWKDHPFVWGIPTPPVPTIFWDDNDWIGYCRQFRPAGYTGGEYDNDVWLDYIDQVALENFRKFWPNHNVELVGRDKFSITKK